METLVWFILKEVLTSCKDIHEKIMEMPHPTSLDVLKKYAGIRTLFTLNS